MSEMSNRLLDESTRAGIRKNIASIKILLNRFEKQLDNITVDDAEKLNDEWGTMFGYTIAKLFGFEALQTRCEKLEKENAHLKERRASGNVSIIDYRLLERERDNLKAWQERVVKLLMEMAHPENEWLVEVLQLLICVKEAEGDE